MDMQTAKPILIIAKPGLMRNSLVSYLRAFIPHQSILVTGDLTKTLQMIKATNPQLVLVDSDLTEHEMVSIIQHLRAEQPTARTIALVESLEQQELCLAIGATHALLKGFLDEQLQAAVLQSIGQTV